jgi:putative peptidoglycan lipid II flippase
MLLLRRALNRRVGQTGLQTEYVAKLWTAAALGAAAGWAVKIALPAMHPALVAVVVLGPYGLVFFAATFALKIPETADALSFLRRSG